MLISTGLGVGGAERQVCDLADAMSALGNDVAIVSLVGEGETKPRSKDVKVYQLQHKKSTFGLIRIFVDVAKLINKYQPDVVHSNMVHANLICRLIRLRVSLKKLICTAHSKNEGGVMRMWAYKMTNRLADMSTNVSQEALDAFIEKGAFKREKALAISNGIDVHRFNASNIDRNLYRRNLALDEKDFLFLAVGRLTEAKDYPNLFHAISSLKSSKNSFKLAIVGQGKLEEELKLLARQLDIENRVLFLGVRDDVAAWMNASDAFVLSSEWEGFGLVVAEAMACEKVVVATDAGGVREVLGGNGFLVPTKSPNALADAMMKAMSLTEEQKQTIGKDARQHVVENYSIEKITQRWLALYQSTAEQKSCCDR